MPEAVCDPRRQYICTPGGGRIGTGGVPGTLLSEVGRIQRAKVTLQYPLTYRPAGSVGE